MFNICTSSRSIILLYLVNTCCRLFDWTDITCVWVVCASASRKVRGWITASGLRPAWAWILMHCGGGEGLRRLCLWACIWIPCNRWWLLITSYVFVNVLVFWSYRYRYRETDVSVSVSPSGWSIVSFVERQMFFHLRKWNSTVPPRTNVFLEEMSASCVSILNKADPFQFPHGLAWSCAGHFCQNVEQTRWFSSHLSDLPI